MSRVPVFRRLSSRLPFRIVSDENEPVILPFLRKSTRATVDRFRRSEQLPIPRTLTIQRRHSANRMDPLTRARALHENRCCPRCRRACAVPVDLGDGDERYAAMPIPGTATLVGFFCDACGAEWAV
jgi:hypothetical protein